MNTQLGDVKLENPVPTRLSRLAGTRALLLPFAFALSLAGIALLRGIRQNPRVLAAFLGAAVVLWVWNALLLVRARRTHRTLTLEVALKKQHYVQACAQLAVLLYWGWYWPPAGPTGPPGCGTR